MSMEVFLNQSKQSNREISFFMSGKLLKFKPRPKGSIGDTNRFNTEKNVPIL